MANDVRIRATVNDQVSGPLSKIKDKFDTLGKSKGFQSIAMGVGVGIGAQVWAEATGRIVGAIGDAIEAAKQEEVSIQKLGSALEANIASWDGNTDAIERVLTARMKLGFSDDEQRDSLAKLVAATGDATEALDIQRTAMDLARFKGISLADATDALTKVEAGSYRILKSLGIVLKEGATQTEALAAVQRVAAGQAEDYARTNSGKLEVSQVKVNEAMEKFGTAVLPAVADAASTAADAITGVSTALDIIGGNGPKTTEEVRNTEEAFIDLARAVSGFIPVAGLLADAMEENTTHVQSDVSDMAMGAKKEFDEVGDDAKRMGRRVGDAADDAGASFSAMVESMIDDTQQLIDDVFDPIETRAAIYQSRMDQNAAEEQLRDAKTAREKREATDDIMEAIGDQADSLVDLGKQGKLTEKDIDRFEKDVKQSYEVLGKEVPKDIQAIIDKLRALDKWDGHTINVTTRVSGGGGGGKPGTLGHRAVGGPVKASEVYMVGESGPELFVSDKAGSIVPNHKLGGKVGPMGLSTDNLTVTVNVMAAGVLTPAHGQAIAREVAPYIRDYLNRRG